MRNCRAVCLRVPLFAPLLVYTDFPYTVHSGEGLQIRNRHELNGAGASIEQVRVLHGVAERVEYEGHQADCPGILAGKVIKNLCLNPSCPHPSSRGQPPAFVVVNRRRAKQPRHDGPARCVLGAAHQKRNRHLIHVVPLRTPRIPVQVDIIAPRPEPWIPKCGIDASVRDTFEVLIWRQQEAAALLECDLSGLAARLGEGRDFCVAPRRVLRTAAADGAIA